MAETMRTGYQRKVLQLRFFGIISASHLSVAEVGQSECIESRSDRTDVICRLSLHAVCQETVYGFCVVYGLR